MADQDNLGDLVVNVTGDYSELQSSLEAAQGVATEAGDAIASAFTQAANASGLAGRDLEIFTSILEADKQAGIELSQSLQDIAASAGSLGSEISGGAATALEHLQSAEQGAGEEAQTTAGKLDEEADASAHVASSSHEAESGLAAMAEQLVAVGEALIITEGLKELGQEALTAFGTVQSVTIGLTQLTGSAQEAGEAIEQIKQLAATQPFAFPDIAPTIQKMVALGVSMEQLPAAMQAVADASAATGNGFSAVANSLDRISLSGNAGARQLTQLGLSVSDLAKVMHVSDEEFKQAFKDLDQSERIDVLTQALQKFAGASEAQAQGIAGQWKIFKNQFEEVMVAVGDDLAPVVADILAFGKTVLEVTQEAATAFKSLPVELQDIIVVFGLAAAAAVPLTGAIGAFGLALAGLNALLPAVTSLLGAAGVAATEDAAAEAAAAAATTAHGAAAAGAAGEIEALADVETGAAAEGGALALSLGSIGTAMGAIIAYGGPVVAAIAVTVENLKTLKAQWEDVDKDIKSHSLSDAINSGNTIKELQNIGFTANDVKQHFSDMGLGAGTVMQQVSNSISKPMEALKELGFTEEQVGEAVKGIGTNAVTAFQALKNAASISDIKDVGLDIDKITAALNRLQNQAKDMKGDWDSLSLGITVTANGLTMLSGNALIVHNNIGILNDNVAKAKATLDQLKASSDGSARSLQDIEAATHNLEGAQKTLATALGQTTTAQKAEKDSLQDLLEKSASASLAWSNARETLNYLNDTLAAGVKFIGNWDIAADLIPKAQKNMEAAFAAMTGKLDNVNTKLLQGEDAIKGWMGGIAGFTGPFQATITQFDAAGKAIAAYVDVGGRFVKITADGEAAAGGISQKMVDVVHGLNDLSGKAGEAAGQIQVLTSKTDDATRAWVNGKIAVQDYNGNVQIVDVATQQAIINTGNFAAGVVDLGKAMKSTEGYTNEEADALLAVAAAADKATDSVKKFGGSGGGKGGSKSGGGGPVSSFDDPISFSAPDSAYGKITGSKANGETLAATLLVDKFAPLLSAFVDAWGLGQSATNQAQALATALGVTVHTLDGDFIPASQIAANVAKAMADAMAGAAAQTAANTALGAAQQKAADDFAAAVKADKDTVLASAQAWANSTGELVHTIYGDVTPALDAVTTAATNTSSTIAALSNTVAGATGAVGVFAQAATTVGNIATAIVQAVAASTANLGGSTTFGPDTSNPFYTSGGAGGSPGGAGAGIVPTILTSSDQYNPSSYGYTSTSVSSGYPGGGGVNLTVNVTGNSVTSQALVNSLADKVGSVIITNLRTNAGLKL